MQPLDQLFASGIQLTLRGALVLMPMQDKAGENIGLVVYAFKNPPKMNGMEEHYLKESTKLRNDLAKRVPSYDKLFEPVK